MAVHIPGVENVQADFLSRGGCLPNQWIPMVLEKVLLEESDLVFVAPFCPRRCMVSSSTEVVSRSSESISVKTGPSGSDCFIGETPQRQRPSSFSMAIVGQQAE